MIKVMNMDLTDRVIEGLKEIHRLKELLQNLAKLAKKPHNECGDDEFYSCEFIKQMSDGLCNCGADEHNIKVTSLLKERNDS